MAKKVVEDITTNIAMQMADLLLKVVEHVGDMKSRHIITCR